MQESSGTITTGRPEPQQPDRPHRQWRISGLESCRPPRTRVEAPAAALGSLVTRYETWLPRVEDGDSDPALWVLPGEARLLIAGAGSRVSALIGNRRYDGLPQIALFGPTSRATRLTATGGPVLTIGLSALGWAAVVARSAAALGDRVVAGEEVLDARLTAALTRVLAAGADGVAARIDAALAATPPQSCPDEPLVKGLTAIIEDGSICAAEVAGEQLGVPGHIVRRSALRHFGYPPKVLLNRRRFIHALERMILSDRGYSEAARHGYFDASHFIRDAKRFLGMTPRRFLMLAA